MRGRFESMSLSIHLVSATLKIVLIVYPKHEFGSFVLPWHNSKQEDRVSPSWPQKRSRAIFHVCLLRMCLCTNDSSWWVWFKGRIILENSITVSGTRNSCIKRSKRPERMIYFWLSIYRIVPFWVFGTQPRGNELSLCGLYTVEEKSGDTAKRK